LLEGPQTRLGKSYFDVGLSLSVSVVFLGLELVTSFVEAVFSLYSCYGEVTWRMPGHFTLVCEGMSNYGESLQA
jgi:hypothetical protein